jgi:hypothetical protein
MECACVAAEKNAPPTKRKQSRVDDGSDVNGLGTETIGDASVDPDLAMLASGERNPVDAAGQKNHVDDDDSDESASQKIVLSKSGLYEWGFKYPTFYDEDQDGVARFKELLFIFGLEEGPLESESCGGELNWLKFAWVSHKDNMYLKLLTCNNPITGQYGSVSLTHRDPEKGYLSYVGVESDSAEHLREFIQEVRQRSNYIKEESNGRVYI